MIDTASKVREHYTVTDLIDRIKAALETIAPEDQPLTVSQLAPIDHFHSRGILATTDLADAVGLSPTMRVLDLGCGIGGPARYFAETFGCTVVGVDLSPSFIDAATYLTARCGPSDRLTFQVGDALHTPLEAASFDVVFLHHVAMNIEDRVALYAEVRRVLKPKGRFAIHDIVLRDGDIVYPAPWARDASTSFLLREGETRATLEHAGFKVMHWSDDTKIALDWWKSTAANPPTNELNLSIVMGSDFPVKSGNLARNIRENRVGVLSAVCTLD
ncbi:methyltransferase domain-containing protein [Granulicella sp. dw_53]|uniref:class I SAM-dependent methyltransferase n=1 Tax=Granulicella sp. dw_53 TaxID=2719792 RepID=UPI001BD34D48|nr:methyltransferase domain-containing protein [Granulicella sp. dw_53]